MHPRRYFSCRCLWMVWMIVIIAMYPMKGFRPLKGFTLYLNNTDDSHHSALETLYDCLMAAKSVMLFRSSAREITLCLLPSTTALVSRKCQVSRNCHGVEKLPWRRGTAKVKSSQFLFIG